MRKIIAAIAFLALSPPAMAQVSGPGAFSGAASFGPQNQNSIFAAPSASAGIPTFRILTSGDFGVGTLSISLNVVSAKNFVSTGTVPTVTTGTCAASAPAGGAMAGKFTAPVCAAGTIILSGLPAATTGLTCDAHDLTTPANALNQTAYTTTSVTFTATTTAGDEIDWKCVGW